MGVKMMKTLVERDNVNLLEIATANKVLKDVKKLELKLSTNSKYKN